MANSRYSSYISSKTLWQNEIPSHWQETELRMLFADNKNKNIGLVERNLLSLSYGKLKRKDIDNATGLVPASFEGYQIIDEGFIVLRFTDLQNDKKSLRVGYVEERGIITSAYIGLAPKADIHSKYFYYQLHFLDKIKYFYNLGGGVRQSLAFKEFGRETVLIPPKEEQTLIARFLDYKLAKINRFIQKKKQLIKLLNEQKAAIINQAVTKGLDPNAKMKDSGIEWLGEIPEHWAVRKLKYVAKVKTGKTPKIESSLVDFFENGTVDWFTPGDFGNDGILNDSNRKINELAISDSQISLFPEKTVFMIGIGGTIGKIGICFDESSCNQQINALIFNNLIEPLYAYYFLKTQKYQIDLLADFTTLPILNQSKTKDIIFVYPKKDEQQQIVSFIEKETAIINTTIFKIETELALTEEYKTALIAEAVTGKIDVRGYEVTEISEEEPYYQIEEEISMVAEDGEEYEIQSEDL
ncbi:restriction endonuclease subunit S [Algoriphagus litoralis]|uniref:restriction endonuclease subunit S n=1 Tax=Algoriphagus litoralis TaxID=2202829 RepID=UPI000DB9C11C|nr:restriction endonuclease subunit S [Algoriphagus litoralis]